MGLNLLANKVSENPNLMLLIMSVLAVVACSPYIVKSFSIKQLDIILSTRENWNLYKILKHVFSWVIVFTVVLATGYYAGGMEVFEFIVAVVIVLSFIGTFVYWIYFGVLTNKRLFRLRKDRSIAYPQEKIQNLHVNLFLCVLIFGLSVLMISFKGIIESEDWFKLFFFMAFPIMMFYSILYGLRNRIGLKQTKMAYQMYLKNGQLMFVLRNMDGTKILLGDHYNEESARYFVLKDSSTGEELFLQRKEIQ